jgi:dynein heavy chain
VAIKFLDDVEINDQLKAQSVSMFTAFHKTIISLGKKYFDELKRRVYITPTSFLELIKTFKMLFDKRRGEILFLKERYLIGLQKLESATINLQVLKNELTDLKPKMIKMSEETEELINIIEKEAG